MPRFKIAKVIAALPATLLADAFYAVRTGQGFDLFATDDTGQIAHKLNRPIFGQNFFEKNNDTFASSTGRYNLRDTVTTGLLPAGKYRVGYSAKMSYTATTSNIEFDLTLNQNDGQGDVIIDHLAVEPKDAGADQFIPMGSFTYITLSQPRELTIKTWYGTDGIYTTRIQESSLEFWRVA